MIKALNIEVTHLTALNIVLLNNKLLRLIDELIFVAFKPIVRVIPGQQFINDIENIAMSYLVKPTFSVENKRKSMTLGE